MNYYNNCENVVFLWINQRNGKIYTGVQQNPDKKDWVYKAKYRYEKSMNNINEKHVPMPKEFYEDFLVLQDAFNSIIIYFNKEQEGFDFRNRLFEILLKYDLTYNKINEIKSHINHTNKNSRIFDTLLELEKMLNMKKDNLPEILYKVFNNYCEPDIFSTLCEDTSLTNNEITREKIEKEKKNIVVKSFCKCCHMELLKNGICQGSSRCDYYGEKAPIEERETKI